MREPHLCPSPEVHPVCCSALWAEINEGGGGGCDFPQLRLSPPLRVTCYSPETLMQDILRSCSPVTRVTCAAQG